MSKDQKRNRLAWSLYREMEHAYNPRSAPSESEWVERFGRHGLTGDLLADAVAAATSVHEVASEAVTGEPQHQARRAADSHAHRLADAVLAAQPQEAPQTRQEIVEAVLHPERTQNRQGTLEEVMSVGPASTGQVTVKAQGPPRPERNPLPRKQ
jgi:hypothetical protein